MAYTPTNWIKGDLITAAKLNKMEQGIANMETGGVEIADNLTETTKGKALDATQGKILKEDIEAIATSDSATQVVSFTSGDSDLANATSWTGATPLTSGETHQSLFNKISTMIKNVKYFYNLIGTTDFTGIGETTITGALSALNTNKLNTSAVVDSLTSTSTTDALAASAGKSLKDSVSSLNDAITSLKTNSISTNLNSGTVLFTINDGKYVRSGNLIIVSVRGTFSESTSTGTSFPLVQLPYVPSYESIVGPNILYINNTIYANGAIMRKSGDKFYLHEGAANGLQSGTVIGITCAYITNGTAQ